MSHNRAQNGHHVWEHEAYPASWPTKQTPTVLLAPGQDPFPPIRTSRERSIFAPVFWAVLGAMVVYTAFIGGILYLVLDQSVGP